MDFIELCGSKGIKREYSNARTPQQNGVAERKNMTLIKAARTMLADSFLPNTFGDEAVSTACYVLNRVLVTKPHNKTPYELVTGKGPTWLFNLDYLTDSMNYQPVRSKNQANKHAGPQEANHNVGTKDNIDVGDSEKEDESAQELTLTNENPVDKEDQVFLDELKTLKRQEKDANDAAEALRKEFAQETEDLLLQARAAKTSSTNIVNTAKHPRHIYIFTNLEPVVNVSPIPTSRIISIHPSTLILGDPQSAVQTRNLPYGRRQLETKIIYRNKKDERGVVVRNKARLVAQGHRQEEGIDYDEIPNNPQKSTNSKSSLMGLPPKLPGLGMLKRANQNWNQNWGLWYPRVSSFNLEAYSDSDYARANLDRKSTTGGCQFLGRRLISWQCKKQTIVATSTTKAEYVAAIANCYGQVLWIQNQMLD
ncbi:putative ribonuclease H-like domain-containing protein [Tanacetum coccineum]